MIGEVVLRFLAHANLEAVVGDLPNDFFFRSSFRADCDVHPARIVRVIAAQESLARFSNPPNARPASQAIADGRYRKPILFKID